VQVQRFPPMWPPLRGAWVHSKVRALLAHASVTVLCFTEVVLSRTTILTTRFRIYENRRGARSLVMPGLVTPLTDGGWVPRLARTSPMSRMQGSAPRSSRSHLGSAIVWMQKEITPGLVSSPEISVRPVQSDLACLRGPSCWARSRPMIPA
jgi:hypothetical protein